MAVVERAGGDSTRSDISFSSGDQRCAAWLYRPRAPTSAGVVVMAHGLGAPRHARLDVFAARIAAAGIAVVLFDYRHLGASEGQPRQLVDIGRQLADWRAAVAFARGLEGIDPEKIALFGTSFGGGHALVTAAEGTGIAAVVAQTPYLDPRGSARYRPRGLAFAGLVLIAFADRFGGRLGLPPLTIPICTAPGRIGALATPDAREGFRILDVDGAGVNRIAARVMLELPDYRPGKRVTDVRCPVLYVLAEEDWLVPIDHALRIVAETPNARLHRFPGGHFDVYRTETPLFENIIAAEVAFLKSVLC
ncbi:MAG: alpha/beta hydrolase [Rhizobiaceae bacterium]|nr:alpha/beta hydrolase [Rhizobiaceae bacterium]MCV0407178.1 alpha/beta hydrolase [Rhizobiaceae bacterium]